MRVKDYMVKKVITIGPGRTIFEASKLMKRYSIRHLPVVERGKFSGLITEGDIREVMFPSMIEKITVKEVMLTNPVTVDPEESLEGAARLIYKYKIGGLPVVQGDKLVGILTVPDILQFFIQCLGVLQSSSRIDVEMKASPESFEEVSRIIQIEGGTIISVGIHGSRGRKRVNSFRLRRCKLAPIAKELEKQGYRVVESIE